MHVPQNDEDARVPAAHGLRLYWLAGMADRAAHMLALRRHGDHDRAAIQWCSMRSYYCLSQGRRP